jgi:hypothetical protein
MIFLAAALIVGMVTNVHDGDTFPHWRHPRPVGRGLASRPIDARGAI